MTIMGLRTVQELRGTPCMLLHDMAVSNKTIICSRSFYDPVMDFMSLSQALARYVERAAEKMRAQTACAAVIRIWLTTSRFASGDDFYATSSTIILPEPSDHTPTLIAKACNALQTLYKHGYRYKKVGVMLTDFVQNGEQQQSILGTQNLASKEKNDTLMQTIDQINRRWGRHTATFARSQSTRRLPERLQRSARFTTAWEDLLVVKARDK